MPSLRPPALRAVHVAAASVLLTYYWLVVRFGPRSVLRRAQRTSHPGGAMPSTRALARHDTILSAVQRAADLHPLRPRCLEQALASRTMLRWCGDRARVVIGVSTGAQFSAHAWVEVGDYANDASRPDFVELIHLS